MYAFARRSLVVAEHLAKPFHRIRFHVATTAG
jgi:hypothetical protein